MDRALARSFFGAGFINVNMHGSVLHEASDGDSLWVYYSICGVFLPPSTKALNLHGIYYNAVV